MGRFWEYVCLLLFWKVTAWVVSGSLLFLCSVLLLFVVLESVVMGRCWNYCCLLLCVVFRCFGRCRHGSLLEVFLFYCCFLFLLFWKVSSWVVSGSMLFVVVYCFFLFWRVSSWAVSGNSLAYGCLLMLLVVLENVVMGRFWECFCLFVLLLLFVVIVGSEGVAVGRFWKYFGCCCF